MNLDVKILVVGDRGMVGSALVRYLTGAGYKQVFGLNRSSCDLTRQLEVETFFEQLRPDYVFVCAAKVGGIVANSTYPAEFMYDNLMIETNTIHAAYKVGVQKLLFLGSTCIYPKFAEQPIKEESLLTASLEPTNEAYALAKIAGLKMCDYYNQQYGVQFFSAMPTNLYGIGDNFHPENSHVIPGMIQRFQKAKLNGDSAVTCWGSGTPMREFLYIDDLAEGLVFMMNNFEGPGFMNIGTGEDVTIKELAETIAEVVGFEGQIIWDTLKPDGTPRKVTNMSKLHNLGWKHKTNLKDGLDQTYQWYLENADQVRS